MTRIDSFNRLLPSHHNRASSRDTLREDRSIYNAADRLFRRMFDDPPAQDRCRPSGLDPRGAGCAKNKTVPTGWRRPG